MASNDLRQPQPQPPTAASLRPPTQNGNNSNNNNNKTLGSLLHYFEGMIIAVELKTGKIYQGRLASAEADLGVTLQDATVLPSLGGRSRRRSVAPPPSSQSEEQQPKLIITLEQQQLEIVQIRGSKVRYIHFLEDPQQEQPNKVVDLAAVVKRGMDRERSASQKYKRGLRTKK